MTKQGELAIGGSNTLECRARGDDGTSLQNVNNLVESEGISLHGFHGSNLPSES